MLQMLTMAISLIVTLLCAPFLVGVNAQGITDTEFGYMKYTEFRKGDDDTKIIITSSHAGYMSPSYIPNRVNGCYETRNNTCNWHRDCGIHDGTRCKISVYNDIYSLDVAVLLIKYLELLLGSRPHLVINHLSRIKFDANRDTPEATEYDPEAEQAWRDIHGFIERAKTLVNGSGVVFDIHGHTGSINWIELGYLLSASQLNSPADPSIMSKLTSIRYLASRVNVTFNQLLMGAYSLGGFLNSLGFPAVPSPRYTDLNGAAYFSGGYITQRHGSRDGGIIDAIQIEFPFSIWSPMTSQLYAPYISEGIANFVKLYYYNNGDISTFEPVFSVGDVTYPSMCGFIFTVIVGYYWAVDM